MRISGWSSDVCSTDLADAAMQQATLAAVARCRNELSQRAVLRFYTTTYAVRYFDAVRQATGAETINLLGISYGTRVAQQYAHTYPRHTRTLVLDSEAPNDL